MIRQAMIMAAGYGKRLRPLTNTCPKPLLPVGQLPMLGWICNQLRAAGVTKIVINASYLGHMIRDYFALIEDVVVIEETTPLETAGGILNALDHFEDKPFYVVNGDALWVDPPQGPAGLGQLQALFDADKMDIALLVLPKEKAWGYGGVGDFSLSPGGHLVRKLAGDGPVPYMHTGLHIFHPRIFEGEALRVFSNRVLYDKAQAQGRLFGAVFQGQWFHFGTPPDYEKGVPLFLAAQQGRNAPEKTAADQGTP